LSQEEHGGEIKPCGLVREVVFLGVFKQEVYAPVLSHLAQLGYQEDKNLFIFDYDWRQSVFANATALAEFVRRKSPDPEQRVDILAHSMGGLIARIYAQQDGARIRRVFSAGTPFLGSAKIYDTLRNGWGARHLFMGGLKEFRRTMLSFPSAFELMPRYEQCCASPSLPEFRPDDGGSWSSLGWDGVDPAEMPHLKEVSKRMSELERILATPLSAEIEEVLLVGLDQRTPYRISFEQGEGEIGLRVQKSWAGDGTVVRESAIRAAPVHSTSFADHERILHDAQIQTFLSVALLEGVAEAMRTVPVRPRDRIETAMGNIVELVGVALEAEQPIYAANDTVTARVHVRLGNREALSPGRIRLSVENADGSEQLVPVEVDPDGSDRSNPFEQSFRGRFQTGAQAGTAVLTLVVDVEGAQERVVTTPIGIISQ
jgi:pimeloyl-ACP methyl ester carboxylesterase